MNPAERVRALLQPVIEARGLELFDVEWTGGLLRVSVDTPVGVDLDMIGDASVLVSEALDAADPDPFPGRYVLEVSSPGLERPLRTPAHFRRFVGSRIAIKTRATTEASEGDRRVTGTLEAADDEGCLVDGRRIAYGDVERARTVFEWGGSDRNKGPKGPKGAKALAGAEGNQSANGSGAPRGVQRKARA